MTLRDKVDAPFDTLVGLTTGISVPLTRGADGVYRGTEYFDSTTVSATQHEYRYLFATTHLGPFRRTLSAAEIRADTAVVKDVVRP